MKGTEGREEPTCLPRRRGVGKCSELTQRVRLPELPPEAPAALGDPSRRGSRHSLGPARPASEGKAASTGSAPGQADPLWSGSPPGRASRRKEGGSRGGGGKQSGREQEEEEGGGRDSGPSPALINHPADQMSPLCTREGPVQAHRGAAAPFLRQAQRRAVHASRPLAPGTLPSPCNFTVGCSSDSVKGNKDGTRSLPKPRGD